ncbi:S1 RNA-binding domain-containing protein [Phototrophicus methaneseepsis]|uniref:S1 RNA-binding domain-containing protein n=1 Tax=Phototrophicus methaneseepsis TaxID=2710758 RepID=A0A7S8E5F7_9CHLR|nr:S1 RNA-binding domain-containing protein [Phototrophicus methaneseepsis]QPC80696.1 S1 RNA-binding domain-containing protein [Phototrophicus methaneseepsis]
MSTWGNSRYGVDEGIEEGYWASLLNEGEYTESVSDHFDEKDYTHQQDLFYDTGDDDHLADPDDTYLPEPTEDDWASIDLIMQADEVLNLKVVGYNRGGLLVDWRSLRGFVPASQLLNFAGEDHSEERRDLLVSRVGEMISLRVIELDPEKNRLIFSERAAQADAGTRNSLLQSLAAGDVIEGCVTNLCDFGAFVDLGGIEGLIHISELSWGRVGHPGDMLARGDMIRVFVLEVHPDEARIALSIKRLNDDPWKTVGQRYQVGQVVRARITNVVDFGAFACIEEGLEGLIHFSELAEGHFLHPRNVVAEGDIVQTRILSINGQQRRLGLSLRTEQQAD